jgi:hypothetical protein
MKKRMSLLTVALLCCGYCSSSQAQVQLLSGNTQSTTRSVVASAQDEIVWDDASVVEVKKTDPKSLPSSDAPALATTTTNPFTQTADPSATIASEAKVGDSNPVESIIENSKLQHFSGFQMGSTIAWGGTGRRSDAIADYMRLEFCTNGLWDGYDAERARICAKQHERIYGHPHGCCAAGCGCAVPPVACQTHCRGCRFNRYTQQIQPSCQAAECDSSGGCNQFDQQAVNQIQEAKSVKAPSDVSAEPFKVAFLPLQSAK